MPGGTAYPERKSVGLALPPLQAPDDDVYEESELEVVVPWRPRLRERIGEAWRSRHLLRPMFLLAIPDYSRTILGNWWLLIRPTMDVGGKALIFGGVFGATAPNGVPYFLFLLIGLQGWRLFQLTVMFEARGIRRYGRLTKNFKVPLLLITVAATGRALYELLIYGAFVAGALVYFAVAQDELYLRIGPELLVGLAGLALCLVFAWGVGLFISVLNARAEDVRYSLRYVLQVWLYCTPVVYALDAIPSRFQTLAMVNPLTPVMEMIKYGLLDAGQIRPLAIVWAVGATAATCGLGLWFFNRYATDFIGLGDLRDADDDEEDDVV